MDLRIIDIHSHILPGADDGAEDMDIALEMADIAAGHGTESVILTPHFSPDFGFSNKYGEQLEQRIERLRAELEREGIPLKLYPGMEVFYCDNTLKMLEGGRAIGLNRSRYLLVEFSMDAEADEIFSAVKDVKRAGYVPVIAHPERYEIVKEYPEFAHDLVGRGVLCQCNAGSVMGIFGRRSEAAAHIMLRYGDLHFIASDCHDIYMRTPVLSECYKYIYRRCGERVADRLFCLNPQAVIMNQVIKVNTD